LKRLGLIEEHGGEISVTEKGSSSQASTSEIRSAATSCSSGGARC
jgi:hypothetical protein